MSGHSKWANIQHRKGRQDARRSKIFTKMGKEITIAAKLSGGDIEFNPRLRLAVDKAKAENMPKDNIERAVKRGTGELDGVEYEEVKYEGYGPGGVAIIVEGLTDNKNRTASSVRSIFSKNGGNLGESGSVDWMFNRKGIFEFSKENISEEELMENLLDAGLEDIVDEGDTLKVICEIEDYEGMKIAVDEKNLKWDNSELTLLPQNEIKIQDEKTASQIISLYEKLEDDDDVQNVYSNFDITDEIMEKIIT